MVWKSKMSTRDWKFLHSERRANSKIDIGGQLDFFSMFPFCHYNHQHAIAILDTQMEERYNINFWAQQSRRSLKKDVMVH